MNLGSLSVKRSGLCSAPASAGAIIVGVALTVACGGGGPAAVVSTPTATPTTAATPGPTAPPSAAATCHLGDGDLYAPCSRTTATLANDVLAAIDLLVKQQPALFDLTQEAGGTGTRQYRLKDAQGYVQGVLANLRAAGFCADLTPDLQRIELKNSNDLSESYAIVLSGLYVRRDGGSYRESCTPADFPVNSADIPPLGSGCGKPYPFPPGSPYLKFGCKQNTHGVEYSVLDSTLQINDAAWCKTMMLSDIGGYDGRSFCPVRMKAGPEREACEAWVVGNALDTGRPGPTWTNPKGQYCAPPGTVPSGQLPASGCENNPEAGQFDLRVYNNGAGVYTVSSPNVPHSCTVLADR
jgi:hypothetical protein